MDDGSSDGREAGEPSDEGERCTLDDSGRPCPLCDASMRHRHCKYVCPNHGVVYDCSDTFY